MVVAAESIYVVVHIFLKLSLGFLYLRLAFERWHRNLIRVAMGVVTLLGVMFLLIIVFQCGVPHNYLERSLNGKCMPAKATLGLTWAHAISTTVADWSFALFPFSLLYSSELNRKTKGAAFFILLIGVGYVWGFFERSIMMN